MPCFKPLKGYRSKTGGITFSANQGYIDLPVTVPCGQCMGCRIDRSREWAVRCMHEAQLHPCNTFITLTYDEKNLPNPAGLNHDHFQKFMKRLRKRFFKDRIRFYMCGEYGEKLGRPHYHAILFNFEFPDKYLWQENHRGDRIYRSPMLEKLWQFGFSTIGSVTMQSAAYVARYVTKKITGEIAEDYYQKPDIYTGELKPVRPEYNSMSCKPGIGKAWFDKYHYDVFPHDYCVQDGKKVKTPSYYLKQLRSMNEEKYKEVKKERVKRCKEREHEHTPERMAIREQVFKNKINTLKRNKL